MPPSAPLEYSHHRRSARRITTITQVVVLSSFFSSFPGRILTSHPGMAAVVRRFERIVNFVNFRAVAAGVLLGRSARLCHTGCAPRLLCGHLFDEGKGGLRRFVGRGAARGGFWLICLVGIGVWG